MMSGSGGQGRKRLRPNRALDPTSVLVSATSPPATCCNACGQVKLYDRSASYHLYCRKKCRICPVCFSKCMQASQRRPTFTCPVCNDKNITSWKAVAPNSVGCAWSTHIGRIAPTRKQDDGKCQADCSLICVASMVATPIETSPYSVSGKPETKRSKKAPSRFTQKEWMPPQWAMKEINQHSSSSPPKQTLIEAQVLQASSFLASSKPKTKRRKKKPGRTMQKQWMPPPWAMKENDHSRMSPPKQKMPALNESRQTQHKTPQWATKQNIQSQLDAQYRTGGPDPDAIFGEVEKCDLQAIFFPHEPGR